MQIILLGNSVLPRNSKHSLTAMTNNSKCLSKMDSGLITLTWLPSKYPINWALQFLSLQFEKQLIRSNYGRIEKTISTKIFWTTDEISI